MEPRVHAALDAVDKPENQGKRVKKETTEKDESKPSKLKKRKSEKESSSKLKKVKRMARKSKSPTPPDSGNDDDEVMESRQESPRGNTPPKSPTPTESPSHKLPTPPPSPKSKVTVSVVLTSTSISTPPVTSISIPTTTFTTTISQAPPVSCTLVSSTPISTIPLPPIITQTTTTTLPEQTVEVNVSNMGETTDIQPPVITKPLSPTNSTGSGATLDNDAPVNRQHLQSIHEKLDQLLEDNKAYGGVVLKAFVETAIEQYTKAMDESTDAIKESDSTCRKASADVAEVIQTTQIFLDSLKGYADTNAARVRESVEFLSQSLQEEQKKFANVRSSIQAENTSLISSVSSRLDSLHVDIAKESALREEIAHQASTIEVQKVHLAQAEKEITLLKTERAVFRSCASDVKDNVINLLGAHDPILTPLEIIVLANCFLPLQYFMR
ncbi:hypothetical protein Lser_V15G04290 [Lactuca serriola]